MTNGPLRLILALQQRRIVTGQQVADELSCSVRTIYRYIARLRDVGFDIRGEPGVGYMMNTKKQRLMP